MNTQANASASTTADEALNAAAGQAAEAARKTGERFAQAMDHGVEDVKAKRFNKKQLVETGKKVGIYGGIAAAVGGVAYLGYRYFAARGARVVVDVAAGTPVGDAVTAVVGDAAANDVSVTATQVAA